MQSSTLKVTKDFWETSVFFSETKKGGEFIDRGGRINVRRPMVIFSGVLDLLRNENPIHLHGDGTLSTTAEPVGESEN